MRCAQLIICTICESHFAYMILFTYLFVRDSSDIMIHSNRVSTQDVPSFFCIQFNTQNKNQMTMHQHTSSSLKSLMTVLLLLVIPIHSGAAAFINTTPQQYTNTLSRSTASVSKLKNQDYEDFSFIDDDDTRGVDTGQELARAFYQELEYRNTRAPEFDCDDKADETYTVHASSSPSIRIKASQPTRRTTNQLSPTSRPQQPIFGIFSFLNQQPTTPAASAGLFSGSGSTVYSSGRSIRAEIEILESTIRKNEQKEASTWNGIYVGSPEQIEQVLKATVGAVVLLSATYFAIELSGGAIGIGFLDTAVKDGVSSFMVVLSDGVDIGGAAWMVEESSAFAVSLAEAVVRSVEGLVLL